MDMGINPGSTAFGVHDSPPSAARCVPLDWHGLRARLAASYAARAAIIAAGEANPAASFDSASARVLGTYPEGAPVVNPNASFVIKRVGGNQGDVAGGPITGDRGPK